MQSSHLGVDDSRGVDRDAIDANRCRRAGYESRSSSRELLVLVVLLGVAGSVTGFLQDGLACEEKRQDSLRGHANLVGTVLFQADGRTLVTCGWDRQVKLWQVAEGEPGWGDEIQSLPHDWHVCPSRSARTASTCWPVAWAGSRSGSKRPGPGGSR